MAVSGLLALLDDVANVLDDVSTMSQLAAEKTAKIAEDDLGSAINKKAGKLDPKHEISVVLAVAKGALKNKLLYVIPGTFAIAALAPALITPLCLGSGAYICYEGAKKLLDRKNPEKTAQRRAELKKAVEGGKEPLLRYEKERIAQAIKTDAAMSLELAGFQLGMVAAAPLLTKLAILGITSVGATVLLYTTIIGIIKMDDVALHLAEKEGDGMIAKAQRATGRALLRGASPVMKTIGAAGMTALFYMGGHLMIAKIPGAEHAFAALAETLSTGPGVDKFIELAAVTATGIAGGIATMGAVKAAKKPVMFVVTAAREFHTARLAAPVQKIKTGLWHTLDFFYPVPAEKLKPVTKPELQPAVTIETAETAPVAANENVVEAPKPLFAANDNRLKTAFTRVADDGEMCALPRAASAEIKADMKPPAA